MTAFHMINISNIKNNDYCLVSGASGGVGLALLQLLKFKTKNIYGITSKNKLNKLTELTNSKFILRDNKNINEIEMEIDNIGKFDIVYDVVAGTYVNTFINILKNNGKYICSGAISNRNVEIFWPNFYLKHIQLLGSMLATYNEFVELTNLIFTGKLKPHVFKVFKLKDLEKAHELFESKKFIGKIILDCE